MTYVAASYNVAFSAPTNTGGNSVAILGYEITFKHKDGTYSSITAECNGADSTIMSQMWCEVSLASLTSSPFNLVQGD